MPNYNISDLDPIPGSVSDSDVMEIFISGVNYKITWLQLKTLIVGSLYQGTFGMAGNVFPSNSKKGQYWVVSTASTSLVTEVNGDIIPVGATITSKQDNASTTNSNQWIITYNAI